MAEIRINYQTGDIALPQQGGGFRIYKNGEYRFNQKTNQFAIPADAGGWEIHEAPAGAVKKSSILPMSELPTGDYQFDIEAGIPGALIRGFKGPGDAASGNIPPEEMGSRAAETAMLMMGGPSVVKGARTTIPMKGDVRAKVQPPSAEALYKAADAGYDAARSSGVDFRSAAVKSWADGLTRQFEQEGFNQVNNPATWKILSDLQNPPDGSVVNFNGMVAARRALGDAAKNFNNPSEQRWASMAIDAIDDFLENPPAAAVSAGQDVSRAAQAGRTFEEANANYAAGKRSNALTGKEVRALDRAGATNSGTNLDNQLRQRIDEIIARPKEGRGFTEQEIAFLREVVRGTHGSNAARYVGNFLGNSGLAANLASSGAAALGLSTMGPWGLMLAAAPPAAGLAAKKLSAGLTGRQISLIDALTRMRSPLYRKMEAEAPRVPSSDARTEALLKALILYDSSQPWLQDFEGVPMKPGGA